MPDRFVVLPKVGGKMLEHAQVIYHTFETRLYKNTAVSSERNANISVFLQGIVISCG